ncbi:hypothetical protein Ae717Ps2_7225c [Pseudonocardia sp. Ae717_Ps2]|nr:hypothetical protein Ae717Ps2_7225c [Pseudonocardia sp. Ae717_Ps2]
MTISGRRAAPGMPVLGAHFCVDLVANSGLIRPLPRGGAPRRPRSRPSSGRSRRPPGPISRVRGPGPTPGGAWTSATPAGRAGAPRVIAGDWPWSITRPPGRRAGS